MVLSCTVSEIRRLAENCRFFIPLSYLEPPLPTFPLEFRGEVRHQKTRVIGVHFCRWHYGYIFFGLAVVASQMCEFAPNSVTNSSSRSSKVIDFGTNGKRIYDFQLVINSNYGPIFHRFWDTATYWLEIAGLSYPSLIWSPAPCVPLGISRRGSAPEN